MTAADLKSYRKTVKNARLMVQAACRLADGLVDEAQNLSGREAMYVASGVNTVAGLMEQANLELSALIRELKTAIAVLEKTKEQGSQS